MKARSNSTCRHSGALMTRTSGDSCESQHFISKQLHASHTQSMLKATNAQTRGSGCIKQPALGDLNRGQ